MNFQLSILNGTVLKDLSFVNSFIAVVVQSLSHVWLFSTPWTAAHQASLSFTVFQSLFKLISIESLMPSTHLILCHPHLLLPSVFPNIKVFSNESAPCIRWPKVLELQLQHQSLQFMVISCRTDCGDDIQAKTWSHEKIWGKSTAAETTPSIKACGTVRRSMWL